MVVRFDHGVNCLMEPWQLAWRNIMENLHMKLREDVRRGGTKQNKRVHLWRRGVINRVDNPSRVHSPISSQCALGPERDLTIHRWSGNQSIFKVYCSKAFKQTSRYINSITFIAKFIHLRWFTNSVFANTTSLYLSQIQPFNTTSEHTQPTHCYQAYSYIIMNYELLQICWRDK